VGDAGRLDAGENALHDGCFPAFAEAGQAAISLP
jgi:hypothetical protein